MKDLKFASLMAAALVGISVGAGSAFAQDQAPDARNGVLDYGPGAGVKSLTYVGGGPLWAGDLHDGCSGSIAEAPDLMLLYDPWGVIALFVSASSEGDATLMVQDPLGEIHCNDDYHWSSNDAGISFPEPVPGAYLIWVGIRAGEGWETTLTIEERTIKTVVDSILGNNAEQSPQTLKACLAAAFADVSPRDLNWLIDTHRTLNEAARDLDVIYDGLEQAVRACTTP